MSFIGIIIGIVLGLILIAVITKISNSDFRTTTKYDERQVIVRGNGYKYGFWTMAILMLSYSFFEWGYPEIAERIPVQRFYVYFMIMLIFTKVFVPLLKEDGIMSFIFILLFGKVGLQSKQQKMPGLDELLFMRTPRA